MMKTHAPLLLTLLLGTSLLKAQSLPEEPTPLVTSHPRHAKPFHTPSSNSFSSSGSQSEAEPLKEACKLLSGADHDYDGHRAKAFRQTLDALHELGSGYHPNKDCHHPSQAVSDEDLRKARSLIATARPSLHGKPLHHVEKAIHEIDKALTLK